MTPIFRQDSSERAFFRKSKEQVGQIVNPFFIPLPQAGHSRFLPPVTLKSTYKITFKNPVLDERKVVCGNLILLK